MKRLLSLLLIFCMLLGGCVAAAQPEPQQYTATFLNLFDTDRKSVV